MAMATKDGFKGAVKDRLNQEIFKRQKELSQKTSDLIRENKEVDRVASFGGSSGDHTAAEASFVVDYSSGHLSRLKAEITLLEHAKKRVDTGEYGICSGCGEPISLKRLDVMPLTENCTDCASKKEATQKKLSRKGYDPTKQHYAFVRV